MPRIGFLNLCTFFVNENELQEESPILKKENKKLVLKFFLKIEICLSKYSDVRPIVLKSISKVSYIQSRPRMAATSSTYFQEAHVSSFQRLLLYKTK